MAGPGGEIGGRGSYPEIPESSGRETTNLVLIEGRLVVARLWRGNSRQRGKKGFTPLGGQLDDRFRLGSRPSRNGQR